MPTAFTEKSFPDAEIEERLRLELGSVPRKAARCAAAGSRSSTPFKWYRLSLGSRISSATNFPRRTWLGVVDTKPWKKEWLT